MAGPRRRRRCLWGNASASKSGTSAVSWTASMPSRGDVSQPACRGRKGHDQDADPWRPRRETPPTHLFLDDVSMVPPPRNSPAHLPLDAVRHTTAPPHRPLLRRLEHLVLPLCLCPLTFPSRSIPCHQPLSSLFGPSRSPSPSLSSCAGIEGWVSESGGGDEAGAEASTRRETRRRWCAGLEDFEKSNARRTGRLQGVYGAEGV